MSVLLLFGGFGVTALGILALFSPHAVGVGGPLFVGGCVLMAGAEIALVIEDGLKKESDKGG